MRNARVFVAAAFLVVLFCLNNSSFFVDAYNGDIIVYVTETGEMYHRDGCTYLEKSKIPMTLKNASKNYGVCSRCRPPILGQDKENDTEPYYSTWDERSLENKKSENNKESGLGKKKPKEIKESEFAFYVKLIFPALIIIGLYFAIEKFIRYKEQIKLHEARCRGELPGGVPGMPFGTIIGEDGLPVQIGAKYAWGPKYTFYISKKGSVFHRNPWCSKGTLIAVHAVYLGNRRPCKKCRPIKPDLAWFMPYFGSKKLETQNEQRGGGKNACSALLPGQHGRTGS